MAGVESTFGAWITGAVLLCFPLLSNAQSNGDFASPEPLIADEESANPPELELAPQAEPEGLSGDSSVVREGELQLRPPSGFVLDAETLRNYAESDDGLSGPAPWRLSEDELRQDGWQFEEGSFRRGKPLAGLAAIAFGIPIHGVGHLLVSDTDSMFKLLMSEIAALGVAGIGTLFRDASPKYSGLWSAGQTLQVTGLSMLAGGWIADIVGSFKGTTVPLPRNSLDLRGLSAEVHYTALFSDTVDVGSVAVAGLQWSSDGLQARGRFSYGPANDYWRGEVSAEFRIPFLSGGNTYVALWSEFGEELFRGAGWGRDFLLAGGGVSLDIGELLEHTRGLVWQLRVGAGAQVFFYESQGDRRFLRRNVRMFAPVDTLIAMNLNRGLNVAVGYRHRPDEVVGTLTRHGGVFYQRFTVLPIDRLGIHLQLEQGDWLRLWIGVRYYLTNPEL